MQARASSVANLAALIGRHFLFQEAFRLFCWSAVEEDQHGLCEGLEQTPLEALRKGNRLQGEPLLLQLLRDEEKSLLWRKVLLRGLAKVVQK